MGTLKTRKSIIPLDRLLWVGIGMGMFYWFAESILHVYVFLEGDFFSQLLPQDAHEIWKRLLVVALIISLGFYAQLTVDERKMSEKALKESERKYRTLFQDALNPIFLFNDKGNYVDCNRAAADFFEFNPKEPIDEILQTFKTSDRHILTDIDLSSFSAQKNIEIDYSINGNLKSLLINLVPITSFDDTIIYGIGQDITERKKMENDIIIAHTELNQIFQTASVGMRLVDNEYNVIKINKTFAKLSGIDMDRSIGLKCYEDFAGPLCHTPNCPLKCIMDGELEIVYEVSKKRRDGSKIPCILTARPFLGPDGELKGIVESFKDITDLKRIQEELRAERDKLRNILFQRVEGVAIVNSNYIIEYQNESLKLKIGDGRGKTCYQIFRERQRPCKSCIMHKAFKTGILQRNEFDTSDGKSYEQTYTPFRESDGKEKVVVTVRDITEIKASRISVYRSEQLVALGELATGVAHEINNPINGIINYAQILINKHSNDPKVKDISLRIVNESDRVARIVESLLSFARRERRSKVTTSLGEILQDTLTLTEAQMRKDAIQLNSVIPTHLPEITVVPQEIQQVILNILSNARFSLNKKYPKSHEDKIIEISAGVKSANRNKYLQVSFRDHGTGIPGHIIDKVINPFFSTKPQGQGTGLGLSISHGIINEHGGKMFIESKEDMFTNVIVELPVGQNL
jgi:PAS domain S-box-containing protein